MRWSFKLSTARLSQKAMYCARRSAGNLKVYIGASPRGQNELLRNFSSVLNEAPKQPVETPIPLDSSIYPHNARQVKAGVLLSRPPQVTRSLTPFEKAFYLYQRRLNERLALPFPRYFYVKRGTPAALQWKRKLKARLTPARDIGLYHAYGKESWNDELLLGAPESEPEHQVNALLADARTAITEEGEDSQDGDDLIEDPVSRLTDADTTEDERSLNRYLDRTLHLLIKDEQDNWRLPSDKLCYRENLHEAAERILKDAGGIDMNTWVVGNAPIGHLHKQTFFMKARIMGGQLKLTNNKFGLRDFKWLAREEIQKSVDYDYWDGIRNMIPSR